MADTGAAAFEVADVAGVATRVSSTAATSLPIWVVWSASPDARYICLEPWTIAQRAEPTGDRTIAPGATHRYRMAISLRAILAAPARSAGVGLPRKKQ